MSKGSRKREANALRRAEEEARQQQVNRQKKRRRIITACVVGVCVIAIAIGAFAYIKYQRDHDPETLAHNTVIATSANHSLNQSMGSYFIRTAALNFSSNYEDYLETFGLDVSRPLKDQSCYMDPSISWLQYFANQSAETIRWMLGFAEQAKAEGMTLSDTDKAEIDEFLSEVKPTDIAPYLTEEEVRTCLELYYLAEAEEEKVNEKTACTEQEVGDYFEKNKKKYLYAKYASYEITYGEKGDYADGTVAKALADKLTAATSPEEFAALVKSELVAKELYTDETVNAGYESSYITDGYLYTDGDGYSDWMFDGSRKAGDTYLLESDGQYTVFCLIAPAAPDTTATVDVRHILLTADTYGSDGAAQDKAAAVLAEFRKNGATEEAFAELAKTYSEDGNAEQGGIYTGVMPGQMVETFNDWCFDPARQPGDNDIVKTEYGYHVMYFVKAGQEAWYQEAEEDLKDEKYEAIYDEYLTAHKVTLDTAALSGIDL